MKIAATASQAAQYLLKPAKNDKKWVVRPPCRSLAADASLRELIARGEDAMRCGLRTEGWAGFWLIMASAMSGAVSGPALAQGSAPVSDTTECPKEIAAIATCYSAKHPSGAY